jgi:thiamine-phosphate pyrophosphorylase
VRVTANGRTYDVAPGTTVAAFIRERALDPHYVVVERNGEALERARYGTVTLGEGDRLELVRAVAGGSGPLPGFDPASDETTLSTETSSPGSLGEWRRRRLAAARVYVVTGARSAQGDLGDFLEEILDAGVDVVQLREKDAEAGDLLRWAETFRDAAERHQALFFVNDRADVAMACGADGIHVGQNDLAPAFVRALVGDDVLIGLSTHGPEQFAAAAPEADCLSAGPVYETPTKPGRPATGLELVRFAAAREASGEERRPWFAIGGIDERRLPGVVEAGASRVVVVRAVTEADDAAAAVEALRKRLAGG